MRRLRTGNRRRRNKGLAGTHSVRNPYLYTRRRPRPGQWGHASTTPEMILGNIDTLIRAMSGAQ